MYIDTHCHLTFSDFDADRAMILGNAKKAGVKQFIVPGVDAYSSQQAILLAQRNPDVIYAAIGFHPYEANKSPDVDDLKRFLTTYPSSLIPCPIVAIGECGLDYHIYKGELAAGKKDAQKHLFEDQLRLALEHDLPVIMHCRDAFEDFFSVLDSLPRLPRGVIHCFSGGLQELRLAQARNLFMGVDGNVTYAKQLALVVPHIPFSLLLLETDAPYLTPVPHRGTRNEPKYIPLVAHAIAKLQHIESLKIATQTTANAHALFQI